jgi:GAF domain-containing protein
VLVLHSCAGIPDEVAQQIRELKFGQAICGTVAQTRASIHAIDIQNSTYDKANLVRGFGIQCYACNPLLVGDRLLGTLSFASRTRKAFDEDELQFLSIISQYTAVAVDRLRSSEQLRESEERFRAVVDNSTTVIFVKDCEGRYVLINERFETLFNVRESEILGKTDFDYFPEDVASCSPE